MVAAPGAAVGPLADRGDAVAFEADPVGLAQQHGPSALLTVLDAAGPLDLQGGPLQHPRALGPI